MTPTKKTVRASLDEVADERVRQDGKWGEKINRDAARAKGSGDHVLVGSYPMAGANARGTVKVYETWRRVKGAGRG